MIRILNTVSIATKVSIITDHNVDQPPFSTCLWSKSLGQINYKMSGHFDKGDGIDLTNVPLNTSLRLQCPLYKVWES